MELTGSRTIAAPRDKVWAALLDPEVLRRCVPGCTEMSGDPDAGFDATVVQKVGPVKATFKGHVDLQDRKPPHSLTISGEGKGGAAGFAQGGADVTLSEAEGGAATTLDYEVEAKVGGKIAQLGSRIIDSFAKKMADQFFEDFQSVVEGPGIDPEAAADGGPQDATASPSAGAKEFDKTAAGGAKPDAPKPTEDAAAPKGGASGEDAKEKKGWFARLTGG